jgi:hypothetical protein
VIFVRTPPLLSVPGSMFQAYDIVVLHQVPCSGNEKTSYLVMCVLPGSRIVPPWKRESAQPAAKPAPKPPGSAKEERASTVLSPL